MIPRIFILCVRLFACVPHVPLPVITVLKPNEDKEGLQEVALQNGHGVGSDLRPNWAIRNKGPAPSFCSLTPISCFETYSPG